uniref:Uncharacterized protein n=1 Tax=Anguilla anguilla TaxID=7936 RepID=A0A0E9PUX8_ANGAN
MSPQHVLKSQVQIFKKGGPLFFNDTSEHTGTHSVGVVPGIGASQKQHGRPQLNKCYGSITAA